MSELSSLEHKIVSLILEESAGNSTLRSHYNSATIRPFAGL